MYVAFVDWRAISLVSVNIERLSATGNSLETPHLQHVYECRSDVAKLEVTQLRVRGMLKELHDLQKFLSSSLSNSTNTHSVISASLRSTEFMFEGILTAIYNEQQACISSLQEKLPILYPMSRGSTGAMRTRFQVDDTWDPPSLLTFTSAGIEYQMKAPVNTKPGDWLEFDSTTCMLTKFDR